MDPNAFIKQIADAGYQARKDDIRLILIGKLTKEADRLVFTMDDVKPGPLRFEVIRGTSKDEKESKSLATAYEEASNRAGQKVEIEGYWKPADTKKDKTALPTLAVTHVSDVKPDEKKT